MSVTTQLSDIMRRVRALKATRPVYIAQTNILEVSQSFSLVLPSGGDAKVTVIIECGGDPLVDVSYSGLATALGSSGIAWASENWTLSGNTATAQCTLTNVGDNTDSRTITITAWAINGLSASFERIS